MEFRHEWKNRITHADVMTLEHRLSAVAGPDIYSANGYYQVHSLIFEESRNEMFRIRYYNADFSLIKLEKITVYDGLTTKESCEVTREFVETILYKSFSDIIRDPMGRSGEDMDPLIQEFYWKVVGNGLKPRILVNYDRKTYEFPQGNGRICIDRNIRSDRNIRRFLHPELMNDLIFDDRVILNIKWDKYLPEAIRSAVVLQEQSRIPGYDIAM